MQIFIAYYRTSTTRQDLGLEAQEAQAVRYAASVGGTIAASFREQESGKNDRRPQLAAAIAEAKRMGATLLIAKLDRLSRHALFLLTLIDQLEKAGVGVVAADMPAVCSNILMLHVMAGLAEQERRMISERTKAALAVKKAQGVKLGREKGADTSKATAASVEVKQEAAKAWAASVLPMIKLCRNNGAGLEKTANALNEAGISTRKGGRWTATSVKRVLALAE